MNAPKILQMVLDVLNLSQYELAAQMTCNSSSISEIFKGRCKSITPKTAQAICDAFPGISYTFLTTGEGSPYADGEHYEPQQVGDTLSASERLQYILRIYKINTNQLALAAGLGRGNLSVIIKGNGKLKNISSRSANLIVDAFPSIRKDWLRFGTGAMFKDGRTVEELLVSLDTLTSEDIKIIPLQPISKPKTAKPQPKKHVMPHLSMAQQIAQLKKRVAELESHMYSGMVAEDIHPNNKKL